MRSSFAAILNGFTLPFGRTSGRRIVFDGPNGSIRFYDASDNLRLEISTSNPSEINFYTANADEAGPAAIRSLTFISGGETYLTYRLSSPSATSGSGDETAQLDLLSRSVDGSEPPSINLRARLTSDDLRLGIADDSAGARAQPMGTAVLVAGTVTVTHSTVTASSRIIIWRQVAGGTLGNLSVGAIVAGTSFVINSDNALDTSTVGYLVIEPL